MFMENMKVRMYVYIARKIGFQEDFLPYVYLTYIGIVK